MILPKFADLLKIRISGLLEIMFVATESVMLPEMPAVPGVGGVIPFPAHAAVNVMGGADGKAAFGKIAVGGFEFLRGGGGLAPRRKLAADQIEKRRGALGEIGRFGGPVIHLDVDVGVVIRMPRRLVVVVPKPLQVRGQPAGARTRNQKVAAILEK